MGQGNSRASLNGGSSHFSAAMPPVEEVNKTRTRYISNGVGNGLFADSDFQPGDVIFRISDPYVLTPQNSVLKTVCYWCLSPDGKLLRCPGCRTVKFCSVVCQAASSRDVHKLECKSLRKVKDEGRPVLPTPVRGLMQILLRHPSGQDPDPGWSHLMTHREDFFQKERTRQDLVLQAQAALHYGGLSIKMLDIAVSALCSMKVNAFNATDSDDSPIGLCFEPLLAKANHSCLPNSFVSFDSRRVSLRALKPIQKDEEITIAYIDCTQPLEKRQQQLEDRYLFGCKCPRCVGGWNSYAAFLQNPCIESNILSIISSYDQLISEANRAMNVSTKRFDACYNSIDHLLSNISTGLETPESRWKKLRDALERLDGFGERNRLAVTPYPIVLRYIAKNYESAKELEAALIVMLTLVFHVEPYDLPEPWHPVRVASLHKLADLLGNIHNTPGLTLEKLSDIPLTLVTDLELLPCTYAVLLLVAEYGPLSHGPSSRFMNKVCEQLIFTEGQIRHHRNEDGVVMLKYGIKDGAGRVIAVKYFRRLEALANVDIMRGVVNHVDCKKSGVEEKIIAA